MQRKSSKMASTIVLIPADCSQRRTQRLAMLAATIPYDADVILFPTSAGILIETSAVLFRQKFVSTVGLPQPST